MPIYEYECTTCGRHVERMQKFSEPPLRECPECHGELKKVLTPAGIIFKGSGWYSTDSRKSSSAATTANGSSKAKDANGSGTPGDHKESTAEGKSSGTTAEKTSASPAAE